jgi:hypothetical protein
MKQKSKLQEIASNPSAYVTLTLILFGFLQSVGISVDITNDGNVDIQDAAWLVNNTWQRQFGDILNFVIPIVIGIIGKLSKIKLVKQDVINYVKGTNFITLATSLIVLILGAFIGQSSASVVVITILNILNFIYHLNLPIKNDNSTK